MCSLPVRERLRVWKLPHPAQSENLDHAVRVQSSLQATRHALICGGRGPAQRRHSVMLANLPLSSTQLTPANTGRGKNVSLIMQSGSRLARVLVKAVQLWSLSRTGSNPSLQVIGAGVSLI